MTLVVDASVVVGALVDSGPIGQWAVEQIQEGALVAPALLHAEVGNVLRRAEMAGDISSDVAELSYADLLDLRVDLAPYEPFSERIWELRHSTTTDGAWYVAVAEQVDAPLATLDQRLAAASGPRCRFVTP